MENSSKSVCSSMDKAGINDAADVGVAVDTADAVI